MTILVSYGAFVQPFHPEIFMNIKNLRTGGQLVSDALQVQGADSVFCVPGESYLEVLDALFDARNVIRVISCRH
jgi:acetolactate synthase-1/2/3 large subunit